MADGFRWTDLAASEANLPVIPFLSHSRRHSAAGIRAAFCRVTLLLLLLEEKQGRDMRTAGLFSTVNQLQLILLTFCLFLYLQDANPAGSAETELLK